MKENVKMAGRILLPLAALLLIVYLTMTFGCKKSVIGTSYVSQNNRLEEYTFYENGTYERRDERFLEDDQSVRSHYRQKENRIVMRGQTYEVSYSNDGFTLTLPKEEYEIHFYWSKEKAVKSDPEYKFSEKYYKSIADSNGCVIENGVLIAYVGDASELVIPKYVKEIGSNSLAADLGYGSSLEKIVVPGTVKKIDENAFFFTSADTIVIEEGVEEIGDGAFSDAYIKEIYYPASVKKIGSGIMMTEEGLNGCKIHVVEGSACAEYFEENPPYGSSKIIYEEKQEKK